MMVVAKSPAASKPYFTRKQAAAELRMSISGVRSLEGTDLHPWRAPGGEHRFRKTEVLALARRRALAHLETTETVLAARVMAMFREAGLAASSPRARLEVVLPDVVIALNVKPEFVREMWAEYCTPLGAPVVLPSPPKSARELEDEELRAFDAHVAQMRAADAADDARRRRDEQEDERRRREQLGDDE